MSDEATGIEHNQFVMGLLGAGDPEPPPVEDVPADFDGGPRETAAAPDEPEKDHGELLKNLLAPRDPGVSP